MTKLILDPGAYLRRTHQKVPVSPVVALLVIATFVVVMLTAVVCTELQATSKSEDIQPVLESFLEATSRGEFLAAYEHLSVRYQDEMTASRFRTEFSSDEGFSRFSSLKETSLERLPSGNTGPESFRYQGRITYTAGTGAELAATLVLERGAWKIDRLGFVILD